MTDTTTPAQAAAPARAKPDRRLRIAGVLAAIALPVLIWVIAVPLLGVDLTVTDERQDPPKVVEIGLGAIVFISAAATLLGWGLLAVLERFLRRARLVWTVIAVLVLLVTFAPLTGSMSGGGRSTLVGLHLAVGVPLIAAFYRSSPGR